MHYVDKPIHHPQRGRDWTRKGGHGWKRIDILDSASRDRKLVDSAYASTIDPYGCLSDIAAECYSKQLEALVTVRGNFGRALEIGCGEGIFSEMLAPRCESLIAVDLSPAALNTAATRRSWGKHVKFGLFDLRKEAIVDQFDLIIVSGVLEYFHRPTVLWAARTKLVRALTGKGLLLIDTTRANPVVENACWSKVIMRGRRINQFFERHPNLEVISRDSTAICVQTLLRRTPRTRSAGVQAFGLGILT